MTTDAGFRAQRLAKLQRLQELRAKRDALIAQDPGGSRRTLVEQYPTALDFAERFDLRTKRTPALEVISQKMREVVTNPDGRLVLSMPPQEGKLLCGTIPLMSIRGDGEVASPAGFRTMAEIEVGDYVFHPSGKPVQVIAKTERQDDRPLYRVTTSDGRSVIADEQHVWTVQDRRRQKSRGPAGARERYMEWENLTTAEILERGLLREKPRQRPNGSWVKANALRLPRQEAVQTADVELPIEPYLFGLWLADGTVGQGHITEGVADADELADNIEAAGGALVYARTPVVTYGGGQAVKIGFAIGKKWRRAGGFADLARQLGVLDNKHIPDLYLTAGTEQRLALLQGLLDGDGAISSNGNTSRVEYSTAIPELAEQVLFLVRSLGWRATLKDSKATLDGVEKKRRHRVTFTPVQGEYPPFRLKRKADRVQVDKSRGDERHVVTIDSIERVENGSGYCIQVASEDGLFLAGRDLVATHNSTITRWLITWLLCENPDRRIVYASFAQSLARTAGRDVRNKLKEHPELCLPLDMSHRDATDWGIAGRAGGLYSVGVGGALTGRPADCMIIDDPLRGAVDADSPLVRDRLMEWWSSTSRTRLAPGAPVLVIQTRWHESDLAGQLIEQGWPYLNIPALADGQTEDALEREPGEWLISARGRTTQDWEAVRTDVGERTFAALYQGRPAPLEGGIFRYEWFDAHRIPEDKRPALQQVVVGVDPADTGKGDAAGILVAGTTAAGKIVFTADLSGQLSQAQWARQACLAWIRHGAARIVQEHNLGMRTSIPDAWALLYRQAQALADVPDEKLINGDGSRPPYAAELLVERGDHQAAETRELGLLLKDFRAILDAGPSGPRVVSITPKQSKRVRAESVAGAFETGRACILGRLPKLEHEGATWQEGQKSPNRIDTLAMLTTHLETQRGQARIRRAKSSPALPAATGTDGAPARVRNAGGNVRDISTARRFRMAPLPPNDVRG